MGIKMEVKQPYTIAPDCIWYLDLCLQKRCFLVEINKLDNEEGCFASNAYFSKWAKLSISRVSAIINQLKEIGLISVDFVEIKPRIKKRVIRILVPEIFSNFVQSEAYSEYEKRGFRILEGGVLKTRRGATVFEKDNNIIYNNKTNNKNYTNEIDEDFNYYEFLKSDSPDKMASFEMQNKKLFKGFDWDRFVLDFSDKMHVENQPEDYRIVKKRLDIFCRNYLDTLNGLNGSKKGKHQTAEIVNHPAHRGIEFDDC